jgi:hypothetical protein
MRINGTQVREATAAVDPTSGAVVQGFISGTMVELFLLSGKVRSGDFNRGNET